MKYARSIVISIVVVAGGLVALATPAAATALGNRTFVDNTDFKSFGVGGMRGSGSGTITVEGISGTVNQALLYWNGPTDGTTSNAAVTFNGNPITTGVDIGPSDDNCWPFTDSHSYRADVTEFVPGDGSYYLTDFTNGAGADVNGASLIVFFNDSYQANNSDVTMVEGNDSNVPGNGFDSDGWNSTIPNVAYASGAANLQLHVSDGQSFPDDKVDINGQPFLPTGNNFAGNSVPGSGAGTNGNLWDIKDYPITLSSGSNDLILTSPYLNDCLSLVVALVDVPSEQPTEHMLSVEVSGDGEVYTDDGPGISCPGIDGPCSNQFPDGSEVTLTATADEGSDFTGWTGCDSTDGNLCYVTMGADKNVTATFVHQNTLTVTNPGTGTGTITFGSGESPPTCTLGPSTSCSKTFSPGTIVTLSAAAASGSNFSGWSGEGCSGTGTCTVTMNAAKSVIASFNQNSTSNSTSGYVPPGGTIQTCQSTSSTDNTCSAITLPSGGPGATITITEQAGSTSTICSGPCSNQTTFYSITCTPAMPCYTDTKKPVKVILRYKLPGTSTKADMYFQHASTTTSFKIPDCKKNGIANPNPCVSARNRLGIGNNDLQVQVLVTSDDPTIGKR
jgi:hypothetical protein